MEFSLTLRSIRTGDQFPFSAVSDSLGGDQLYPAPDGITHYPNPLERSAELPASAFFRAVLIRPASASLDRGVTGPAAGPGWPAFSSCTWHRRAPAVWANCNANR